MIIGLENITLDYKNLVGLKSFNLSLLKQNNINVSDGVVLTNNIFESFKLTGSLKDFDIIPEEINNIKENNHLFIVRSSANLEDGENYSFAGIFESYSKVQIRDLKDIVLKIYKSVFSKKAQEYYDQIGVEKAKVKMSILVQNYIESKISGVCFTKNPLTNENHIVIEYVEGSNQNFISGVAKAKKLVLDRNGKILEGEINTNSELIQKNIGTFLRIEDIFNKPQDIEWGIDTNDLLFVFQTRDITTNNKVQKQSEVNLKVLAHGYGLSSGIKSGKIKFINTNLKFNELQESISDESIVVTDNLRVDQILAIKKAAGVIIAETSLLSHTAIQAREFGIPCIGGIYERNLFIEGQEVTIDGYKGLLLEGKLRDDDLRGNFDTQFEYQNFPNYYTPEKISEYKEDSFVFLYSIQDNKCMIYLSKVEDTDFEEKAKKIINKIYSIETENIITNKIKIYENKNAASSVFSYYEDYNKVRNNPEFSEILDQAKLYMENLQISKLKDLADSTRKKSHEIYKKGYGLFLEFRESKDTTLLEKSAKYLNDALNLAVLFSNVVIFSYGNYYLEKHLESEGSASLSEFFANPENFSPKLQEFSLFLTSYKNSELEPLQYDNFTMIDVIDYIYENGFEDYVKQYNW